MQAIVRRGKERVGVRRELKLESGNKKRERTSSVMKSHWNVDTI